MPLYRFQAVDPGGKPVEGEILGASVREAATSLSGRNLRVTKLVEAIASKAPSPAPVLTPKAPSPAKVATPSQPVRTKPGTEKDVFLVFSQLASYLKSGINPQQAFQDLKSRLPREDYASSMEAMREAAVNGEPMSAAMERYPDLYPPHAVGMIRAGEGGGFLPDAAAALSEQANNTHQFDKPFWKVRIVIRTMLLVGPLGLAFILAALDSYGRQEKSGGGADGIQLLLQEFGKTMMWPVGPAILLIGVLMLFSFWLWRKTSMRMLRHRIAMMVPVFRKRAVHEGGTLFAWTLSNLSKSGLYPQRAWQLALDVIPNLAFKEKLRGAGTRMHERTPLSNALAEAKVFPKEYALIVQTGETTGTVPQALQDAAGLSRAELATTEDESKRLARSWGCLLSAIGWVFLMYLLYAVFYPGFIKRFLGEE